MVIVVCGVCDRGCRIRDLCGCSFSGSISYLARPYLYDFQICLIPKLVWSIKGMIYNI